ncbi:hypothetical protein MFIFM68171_06520 [Madurella fahalii]|uniref:Uncharacterized protein n=1 Tax=Madurella fahalii TaxID=1157608 RepID=A0ABQ0GEW0_9PEZI
MSSGSYRTNETLLPVTEEKWTGDGKPAKPPHQGQGGSALQEHRPVGCLYLPQILAMLGFNVAAIDLLIALQSLYRAWLEAKSSDSPVSWISHTGQVGAPFTVVTWSIYLAIVRVSTCFVRMDRKPQPPGHGDRGRKQQQHHQQQQQQQRQPLASTQGQQERGATARPYFRRHLRIDAAGLVLPAASLTATLASRWMRALSAAQDVRYRAQPAFPADYLPALYWDGVGEAAHARFALFAGALGALCLYGPPLVLPAARGGQRVLVALYVAYAGLYALAMVPAAAVGLGAVVGNILCSLTGRWGCGIGTVAEDYLRAATTAILWLGAGYMVPVGTMVGVVLVPVVALWYVLKEWVFGAADVARSCIFIPCAAPTGGRAEDGTKLS